MVYKSIDEKLRQYTIDIIKCLQILKIVKMNFFRFDTIY